jgi:hypothetical protein
MPFPSDFTRQNIVSVPSLAPYEPHTSRIRATYSPHTSHTHRLSHSPSLDHPKKYLSVITSYAANKNTSYAANNNTSYAANNNTSYAANKNTSYAANNNTSYAANNNEVFLILLLLPN